MKASIVGIGTFLPPSIRTNDAWPPTFHAREHAPGGDRTFNDIPRAEDPVAAAIVERDLAREASDPFLGVTTRHVADETLSAAEAEVKAARLALSDAGIDAADVDLVLSYSVVPDRVQPTAPTVADRIGARRAHAFGVDTACASAITQLEVARAYLSAGLARVVLLVQSHILLRAMPLEHPATPGLGDGATALVVTHGPGLTIKGSFCHTHGEFVDAVQWVRGSPEAGTCPWWKAGGDYRLGSLAPALVKLLMRDTVSFGARTLRDAASRASIDIGRVGTVASVQPRGFLPAAIAEYAGLGRDSAVTTYAHIAHVGACGPIFNLARARSEGRLGKGSLCALYAQGAGFTRAAAILEATA